MRARFRDTRRGHSLVEMLTASAMLGVVIFSILTLYLAAQTSRLNSTQQQSARERASLVMRAIRESVSVNGADSIRINKDCLDVLSQPGSGGALSRASWDLHAMPLAQRPPDVLTADTTSTPSWCERAQIASTSNNTINVGPEGIAPAFRLDGFTVYVYVYCGLPGQNGGTDWPSGVSAGDANNPGSGPDVVSCRGSGADYSNIAMPRRVRVVVERGLGGSNPSGLATLQTVLDAFPLPAADATRPKLPEVHS